MILFIFSSYYYQTFYHSTYVYVPAYCHPYKYKLQRQRLVHFVHS